MSRPRNVSAAASDRLVRDCGSATKNEMPMPTANMATMKRPENSISPRLTRIVGPKKHTCAMEAAKHEGAANVGETLAYAHGLDHARRLPPRRPPPGRRGGHAEARSARGDRGALRAPGDERARRRRSAEADPLR